MGIKIQNLVLIEIESSFFFQINTIYSSIIHTFFFFNQIREKGSSIHTYFENEITAAFITELFRQYP
jgi:hypothetical protein